MSIDSLIASGSYYSYSSSRMPVFWISHPRKSPELGVVVGIGSILFVLVLNLLVLELKIGLWRDNYNSHISTCSNGSSYAAISQ